MKTNIQMIAVGVVLAAASALVTAEAAVTRFSTANCGGFSTCDDTTFVAGAGGGLTFDDFGPIGSSGSVAGTAFSADFALSSGVSTTWGGTASTNVQYSGDGSASEVGPNSGFTGLLFIDFANPLRALGFGTVELGNDGVSLETISLYGPSGLLATFNAISASVFNYEGFVASGGDVITRAVLDGDFYAIQNIKYAIPEPGTLALLGLGLAGLAALRRRRQ